MSLLSPEEMERRAEQQVGRTLHEKYRLDALLGIGGMAAVYAATHRNGNRVAIKLLYPELTRSADIMGRFIREGYAANRVGHPGAVRVLDDVQDEDGSVFLVMELLEGEAMDSILSARGSRIAPEELMPWMNQLLDVLAAAHEQGIIHRDIKPENLFVTRGGILKVLDFGIARMQTDAPRSVTQTGNQFGTPAFMSPEQARGRLKEVDARSDLYAVGATMFTLLTGMDVHPAESANEMLILAATKPARSVRSVVSDLPEPLARVVDRALAFERDERWQDARQMQAALQEAHREMFAAEMPPPPARVEPSGPDVGHTSKRTRIRSRDPGDAVAVSAETVALPSPADASGRRREMALTAPPTTAAAPALRSSRRWLFAFGAAFVVVLGVSSFVLRDRILSVPAPGGAAVSVGPATGGPPAAPAGAESGSNPGPASAQAPAAGEAPSAASATAHDDTGPLSPAAAPSAGAGASGTAPASNAPPRRKPRNGPVAKPASTSSETSAFEHQ